MCRNGRPCKMGTAAVSVLTQVGRQVYDASVSPGAASLSAELSEQYYYLFIKTAAAAASLPAVHCPASKPINELLDCKTS